MKQFIKSLSTLLHFSKSFFITVVAISFFSIFLNNKIVFADDVPSTYCSAGPTECVRVYVEEQNGENPVDIEVHIFYKP